MSVKNNITIDCRMINSSGIGTYIKNLVPLMINELDSNKYFLLGNKNELSASGILDNNNVECIEFNSPIYSISEQLLLPILIPKETNLFWAPHYNYPVFYRGIVLVSIMDLGHIALRQINHELTKRLYAWFMFKQIKKRADATIYISEFSKNEFNKYIGKPKARQFVTLLGVGDEWNNIPLKEQLYQTPFILYVGNVKPHKNLGALIDAFIYICNNIPHKLVIVGKKEGFITGDYSLVEKVKGYSDRIIFTGKVSDYDLKQYYKQADLFVFPSLYEGFGFPPLEAMAAGTPIVASNAASIPEICGNSVLYFNPMHIDDIVEKILQMINNSSIKNKYIKRGKTQVKYYTWQKTAFQTFDIIKDLLNKE